MIRSLAIFALIKWRSLATRCSTALWSTVYTCYLRVHPGVTLAGPITVTGRMIWRIHPRAKVTIGRNVRIHSGPRVNAFGGHRRTIIWVLPEGQLSIGEGAGLSNSTVVCQKELTIEAHVMIGGACDIFDTDFHPQERAARIAHDASAVKTAPVVIEAGAWIGGRVIIMKGVRVGTEAVIGAGSVVTHSVPPRETWAGNPAKPLRQKSESCTEPTA